MKIDNTLNGLSGASSRTTVKARDKSTANSSQAHAQTDSVDLTTTSSRLSSLADSLSQMDASDNGKVESIRRAISEGSFNVNEETVADALLRNSLEQMPLQNKR